MPRPASGWRRPRQRRRPCSPKALTEGNLQAANYFIAQKYLEALKAFATSPNQKTLILPIEATATLGSLAGIAELARDAMGGRPAACGEAAAAAALGSAAAHDPHLLALVRARRPAPAAGGVHAGLRVHVAGARRRRRPAALLWLAPGLTWQLQVLSFAAAAVASVGLVVLLAAADAGGRTAIRAEPRVPWPMSASRPSWWTPSARATGGCGSPIRPGWPPAPNCRPAPGCGSSVPAAPCCSSSPWRPRRVTLRRGSPDWRLCRLSSYHRDRLPPRSDGNPLLTAIAAFAETFANPLAPVLVLGAALLVPYGGLRGSWLGSAGASWRCSPASLTGPASCPGHGGRRRGAAALRRDRRSISCCPALLARHALRHRLGSGVGS